MSVQTSVKKIEFNSIMKEFKKFTSKKKKNEIRLNLKYVYFDDPYLVATNSHILLRINHQYISDIPENFTPEKLYDIKNQKILDGNYPKVDRIIPDKNNPLTTINNKQANEILKALRQLRKIYKEIATKNIRLEKNIITAQYAKMNDKIFFSEGGKVKQSIALEYIFFPQVDVYLNGDYLKYILETIKKINKITGKDTEIYYYGNLQPILFTQDNIFDALILPIRVS